MQQQQPGQYQGQQEGPQGQYQSAQTALVHRSVNPTNTPAPRRAQGLFNSNSGSSSQSANSNTNSRASSFFSSFRKNSSDMDRSAGTALTSSYQTNPGQAQTYGAIPQRRPDAGQWDEYGRPKSMVLANEAQQQQQQQPQRPQTLSQASRNPSGGPSKLISPRTQALQSQSHSSNSSGGSTLGRRGSSHMKQLIQTVDPSGGIHPEIQQVVGLTLAHSGKVYCSGPLVRRIERNPDGTISKDAKWVDVWAQLGGTTLSVWDMEAIKKASEEGREEPPTYINVTDSHVQVLGSVQNAATSNSPEQRHNNVVTINTAGSNLVLFACPTPQSLLSWATALRLASWEKSRIEEIYTGHLFRLSMMDGQNFREPDSTLQKGKLEGWAKVRISGSTEWQRLWVVISQMSHTGSIDGGRPGSPNGSMKKNRLSGFLGGGKSSSSSSGHGSMMGGPAISMYPGNKSKDKKKLLYTTTRVTQAFAVYPERPEVINASSLFKIEGTIKDEQMYSSTAMRERAGEAREGYAMLIPEVDQGKPGSAEMVRWLIAIHDAFRLYGRPEGYSWNPRDPRSMFFTYPYGPYRDHLFLDRELAEVLDPRVHEVSRVRGAFMNILIQRMQTPTGQQPQQPATAPNGGPQIPPLNFNANGNPNANATPPEANTASRGLTTIREISTFSTDSHQPSQGQPPPTPSKPASPSVATQQHLPPNPAPFAAAAAASDPRRPSPAFNGQPGGSPIPSASAPAPAAMPTTPSRQGSNNNMRAWSPSVGSDNVGRPGGTPVRGTQTPPRPSLDTSSFRANSPLSVRNATAADLAAARESPSHQQIPSIPSLRTPSAGGAQAQHSPPNVPANTHMGATATPPPATNTTPNQWSGQASYGAQPTARVRPEEPSVSQLYNEPGALYMLSTMDEPPEVSPLRDLPPQPLPPRLVALERQRANSQGGVDDTEPSPFATNSNAPSPFASTGSVAAYFPNNSSTTPVLNPLVPAFAGSGSGTSRNVSTGSDGLAPVPGGSELNAKLQGLNNTTKQNGNYHPSLGGPMSASPLPMSTKSFEEQELEADALAALNLVNSPDPETAPSKPPAPVAPASPPSSGSDNGGLRQYQSRSSFAPNSKSMERIANAEAQYAAKQESRSKPGRAKAKQGGKGRNAWGSSDEEEEDDDDESDEEKSPVAKDSQKSTAILSPQPQPHPTHPNNISELSHVGNQYGSESRSGPSRRLPAIPNAGTGPSGQQPTPEPPRNQDYRSAHGHGQDYRSAHGHGQDYRSAHGHNSRPSSSDPHAHRRQPTEQLDEFGRRVAADPGPRQSQAQTLPNRPMWSTVLDPHGEAQKPTNAKDTFIQIEPNETMTMAFTPQGLLQAGMQDKQSRSAKQQEAHARETGASLINVPSAPPPPQMGLVGAITAHQRDREREGGVGAALTERERERRVAEERQRKYDELQRQQLDKAMTPGGGNMDMQQGFNPMMMHPMMWGMPPMMYPNMGWGGGMTPQQQQQQQYQMWAAQQAAMQAYQQTMINLSQAGSQAPSEAGGTPETGMPRSASPMGGWGMGNMPMGSPMMSPMMMPGMMPNMGMMPGMMPGFGMGGVGGSGFMQSPQPPRSPMNDDAARISLAHSNQDSPQTRSLDPSKPASRENYAS